MKSKTTAIIIAVLFGPWVWLGTYGRDRWKYWLSLSLIMATSLAAIIPKLPNLPFSFTTASLYTLFPLVIFLIMHDVISGSISLFFTFGVVISSPTNGFNFIYTFIIWVVVWIWAIIDTVTKTKFNDELRRSNWLLALFFAVFFSYNTWLYTYTQSAKKFWLSFGISTLTIPLCVVFIRSSSIPGEAAFYVLMGLLILVVPSVFIGIWLWAVIDVLSRIRHKNTVASV